ncbi:MAG: hypothetical protein FWC32_02555, partial [Firmicutes bacterium]|nr:hypothetical protein [Bacillota bacterium]
EVLKVAVEGTRTFITRTVDGLQNRSKYYNKNQNTGEWEETVYARKVSENDVPPEILAKVRNTQINIEIQTTEELKLAISA